MFLNFLSQKVTNLSSKKKWKQIFFLQKQIWKKLFFIKKQIGKCFFWKKKFGNIFFLVFTRGGNYLGGQLSGKFGYNKITKQSPIYRGILNTFFAYHWHFEGLMFNYWYWKKNGRNFCDRRNFWRKIFSGGTWLGLFDSVFRIFTSGHFRLALPLSWSTKLVKPK